MTLKKNKRTRKKRGGIFRISHHSSSPRKPKTPAQLYREKQWNTQNMADITSRQIDREKDSIKNKFCEFCSYARGDIIDFNVYYFEANNIQKDNRYTSNNYVKFFDFKEDMLLNNKQHEWMSYLKKKNQLILSLYQKWKGYYDSKILVDAKNVKNLEDWINRYTENIIHMKMEKHSKSGGWVLPFTMKIPNANIDAFLGKKTLEQLLEHMGKDNKPDEKEKKALKKFYETNGSKNNLNDLKKKSNYKCKYGTSSCKRKRDRGGKALQIINNLIGTQTSDVEVKVDENPPTADKGGRRKKRTRRRKKRKRKKTKKRRKRRR